METTFGVLYPGPGTKGNLRYLYLRELRARPLAIDRPFVFQALWTSTKDHRLNRLHSSRGHTELARLWTTSD